jgi:UDPglucose 6-dehydrogenase
MTNIVIAGYGFVGKAHDSLLQKYYNTHIVDPAFNNSRVYDYPEADGLIICVSTPKGLDGNCDIQNVLKVIRDTKISTPILLKSTVSLEGWDRIKRVYPTHTIAFSPEFLRAETALEDFANTFEMYIGGDATDFWKEVFVKAYNDILDVQVYPPEELILAKYVRNSFLATKVAFFNQIYDLCQTSKINYETVAHIAGSDSRITHSHTKITPERGFGGHCFPKDTKALLYTSRDSNISLSILEEAVIYNEMVRTTDDK